MIGITLGVSCCEDDQTAVALLYLFDREKAAAAAKVLGESAEKLSLALCALPVEYAVSLARRQLASGRGNS